MILKSEIEKAYLLQQEKLKNKTDSIERIEVKHIDTQSNMIQIVSGIRRCGKSTLLRQLMRQYGTIAFLNFEDPRIFNFEVSDFSRLDEIIENGTDAYFFDEIQNVPKWELYLTADR